MKHFAYSSLLALTLAFVRRQASMIAAVVILLPTAACLQTPEWMVFNTTNSGLPDNRVWALAIDSQGNKWIGIGGGLAKFDGDTTWTVYNTVMPYRTLN